ncbi:MAG: site-2 protease family protein [Acidobacteria bacterium]|nr:site-2 protease family protein [Acidobacteriota bacterium]|tara:strand:+ start:6216 stop:6716 length:501 start_codon:yes stop_codon:yes gene_type:complete
MVHLDAVGSVFLPLILAMSPGGFVFGWAKPVPVNTGNLKNGRRDFWIVAIAGPASNLALAVAASLLLGAMPNQIGSSEVTQVEPLTQGLGLLVRLNLLLAVFNMLPVPPLDGGNVLVGLLPESLATRYDRFIRPYGFAILILLMLTDLVDFLIRPPYIVLTRWLLP